MELFLARQAALASRVVQTPTNELPSMDIQEEAPANAYLTPQTPQKPGFHSVPVGILTPPITPDKDYSDQTAYGGNQGLVSRIPPACAPTPPPSTEHHFLPQYGQFVQQPQLVH